MTRKKKIWISIIAVVLTIVIILPAAAFAILRWGILPPEKLTPLVVREVNKYIDGEFSCESIELTFFETYPRLGVRIKNGDLLSFAVRDSADIAGGYYSQKDSLISFERAIVSVNPLDYLYSDKITIGGVFLENPHIHGYIDEDGKANWEIYESGPEDMTAESDTTALPPIDLQRLRIKGGHFVYDDRQSEMYAEVDGFSLKMEGSPTDFGNKVDIEVETEYLVYDDKPSETYAEVGDFLFKVSGKISQRGKSLDLRMRTSSILFDSPTYTLKNKMELKFMGKLKMNDEYTAMKLEDAKMLVNNLPFTAEGTIVREDSTRMKVDMGMTLNASDLNDLLAFVPDEYLQNRKKMQVKGAVQLETNIYGFVGDSVTPTIDLCCKVQDGSFFMKGVDQGIESLNVDMDLHLNGISPDSSYVVVEQFDIKGTNTAFSLKGRVDDLFRSPYIESYLKGTIDFGGLAKEFLNPDTLRLSGIMEADIEAAFKVDDILDGYYERVRASGKLNIPEFRAFSRPAGLRMQVSGMEFSVDSTKQTSSYLTNDDLLAAFLKVDSMSIRYKREIDTQIQGVDISAKTSVNIDTTAVMPVTGRIKIDHMRTRLPDSVWVVVKNSSFMGGIKPSTSDKTIPMIAASITVDTLHYFDIPLRSGVVMAANTFNVEALPYRDARRQRMQRNQENNTASGQETRQGQGTNRRQTTGRRSTEGPQGEEAVEQPAERQSNRRTTNRTATAQNRQRQQTTDTIATSGFLSNWEVRGSVKFNETRLMSRMFPLRMHMESTNVRFDTNTLTLTNAKFHAGKSDFLLNGEISSIRRALMRGGKLRANFSIESNYMDCNELMQAASRGMMFADQVFSAEEEELIAEGTFTEMTDEELQAVMTEVADSTDVLFVIPAFLDMTLNTKAKKIDYNDVSLENVDGEMVIRNQSLNLRKLNMDSNIGKGNMTMVYTAKDYTSASAGFELDLENILVERLIGLFPSIDSLLPMLRSFEGVVDCQMAATCDLDSTMSVILPSIHAATYLNGENMVLLDGETFAEISKTLMFKNKEKNLIESISVDLLVRDNKIEVYPFLIEMDRYRAAVGGTHNLDMTFDYHISVLKSPIPFKLGVNVNGDLDNFKFKIGKCKYKDIFKPAREAEMDQTRTSLRAEIRNLIRREMEANAPELAQNLRFEDNFSQRRQGSNRTNRQQTAPDPEEDEDDEDEDDEAIEEKLKAFNQENQE